MNGRPWTHDELYKLDSLLEHGYGYDDIARKLKRSRMAVMVKCKRRKTRILSPARGLLTAREIAAVLGTCCSKTVTRWINEFGWLEAVNAGTAAKPLYRVTWEQLESFMADDRTWVAWHPWRIKDSALREWAQELRAGKPRWLSMGEVAQRLHVDKNTPHAWVALGLLPAMRYGNYFVREDALEGFVLPIDRILTEPAHCPLCDRRCKNTRAMVMHRWHCLQKQEARHAA